MDTGLQLSSTSNSVTVVNPTTTTIYSVSAPGCSGNQTVTVQVVVGEPTCYWRYYGSTFNLSELNGYNDILLLMLPAH